MGYVLTNGEYFIKLSDSGKIEKTKYFGEAKIFPSVRAASNRKKKATSKCASYECICEDDIDKNGKIIKKKEKKEKRKSFSFQFRKSIYEKTNGHCYLCGQFVDFSQYEIEHKVPLAKGGTNELENLFCSCHTCNCLKGSIAPTDLIEKIKQILLYQMQTQYGENIIFRITKFLLEKI